MPKPTIISTAGALTACLIALLGTGESCSSKGTAVGTRHDDAGPGGGGGSTVVGDGGASSPGTGGVPADGGAGNGGSSSGGKGGSSSGGGGGSSTGGGGGSSTGGRGGSSSGGAAGAGMQVTGSGGHDIGPIVCGSTMCSFGLQCCHGCDGSTSCGGACPAPVCPTDAGADAGGDGGVAVSCGGAVCGADDFCCGPPSCGFCANKLSGVHCVATCPAVDGSTDAPAGTITCGTGSCGPLEACVHPPRGGTCVMPDAGVCPPGTSAVNGCCYPPDDPRCVSIDVACSGPTLTCGCFSKDPCGSGCGGALINGRDIACAGA